MQHTCPWWFGYALANPLRRLVQSPTAILGPFVRDGMGVLEVGPGMGFFTPELARLVGGTGSVTVVDIQQRMLDGVRLRLEKAGYAGRSKLIRCTPSDLSTGPAQFDFVLLFFMVHEVRDRDAFFRSVAGSLGAGGTCLLAEPPLHVSRRGFERELAEAARAGLTVIRSVPVNAARAVLLGRPEGPRGSFPSGEGA